MSQTSTTTPSQVSPEVAQLLEAAFAYRDQQNALQEARAHVDNCRKNTRLAMMESDAAERSRDELIALAAQAETYANDKAAAYQAAAQAEANACYELFRLQAPKPAPPAVEAPASGYRVRIGRDPKTDKWYTYSEDAREAAEGAAGKGTAAEVFDATGARTFYPVPWTLA